MKKYMLWLLMAAVFLLCGMAFSEAPVFSGDETTPPVFEWERDLVAHLMRALEKQEDVAWLCGRSLSEKLCFCDYGYQRFSQTNHLCIMFGNTACEIEAFRQRWENREVFRQAGFSCRAVQ